MPDRKLVGFSGGQQETSDSCWACAARAIINWYEKKVIYKSDQELATAWAKVTGKSINANISIQQSASAALGDLKYKNNTDSAPIPTKSEIKAWLDRDKPLLAITAGTAVTKPNITVTGGHWVVIVGINGFGTKIDVFDPVDGGIHTVDYDTSTYVPGQYWQNTSYVDKK